MLTTCTTACTRQLILGQTKARVGGHIIYNYVNKVRVQEVLNSQLSKASQGWKILYTAHCTCTCTCMQGVLLASGGACIGYTCVHVYMYVTADWDIQTEAFLESYDKSNNNSPCGDLIGRC